MTVLVSTYDGSQWEIVDGDLAHLDAEGRCVVRWVDATHSGKVINAECTCGAVLHREGMKPRHDPIRQSGRVQHDGPSVEDMASKAEVERLRLEVQGLRDRVNWMVDHLASPVESLRSEVREVHDGLVRLRRVQWVAEDPAVPEGACGGRDPAHPGQRCPLPRRHPFGCFGEDEG